MSFVKYDFLNWRPDMESYDGHMTTADNAIHSVEGYNQILALTVTSMSELTFASTSTFLSAIGRPQGASRLATSGSLTVGICRRDNTTATMMALVGNIGNNGTFTTVSAGVITTTSGVVTAYQTCELNDAIFFTLETSGITAGGTSTIVSANATGYMTLTWAGS
jgi:hypothetical protein